MSEAHSCVLTGGNGLRQNMLCEKVGMRVVTTEKVNCKGRDNVAVSVTSNCNEYCFKHGRRSLLMEEDWVADVLSSDTGMKRLMVTSLAVMMNGLKESCVLNELDVIIAMLREDGICLEVFKAMIRSMDDFENITVDIINSHEEG